MVQSAVWVAIAQAIDSAVQIIAQVEAEYS